MTGVSPMPLGWSLHSEEPEVEKQYKLESREKRKKMVTIKYIPNVHLMLTTTSSSPSLLLCFLLGKET